MTLAIAITALIISVIALCAGGWAAYQIYYFLTGVIAMGKNIREDKDDDNSKH